MQVHLKNFFLGLIRGIKKMIATDGAWCKPWGQTPAETLKMLLNVSRVPLMEWCFGGSMIHIIETKPHPYSNYYLPLYIRCSMIVFLLHHTKYCHFNDMTWGPASEVINDVDKDRIPLTQTRYICRIRYRLQNHAQWEQNQNENKSGFSQSTDSSWHLIGSQKPLWTNKLSAKPKLNTDWIPLRVRYPIRDISYLVTLLPPHFSFARCWGIPGAGVGVMVTGCHGCAFPWHTFLPPFPRPGFEGVGVAGAQCSSEFGTLCVGVSVVMCRCRQVSERSWTLTKGAQCSMPS